ncbi:type I restriction enzyme HsdR N-terminal domain-containing protein [Ornithinimicrobium sediminis]|uniref:type I restriction enzyme HsdR N-terminal domain-containing protein n=1 Tax=Ornithinimicrobium sediminis TaxID=2904603 RepID=UPI001E51CDEF|nr:type I restriction enzyme HsdR N-terminal domain-containing protein [Ornithinimicrobium sediminis]MCE0486370.1 hypothetical protein [Ornithinimicrobium sediminis]
MTLRIDYALPLGSESRWSDMLATLVATDPEPMCRLLDLEVPAAAVQVHREVAVDRANRPDIVLTHDGQRVAVIEIKVLAGLGYRQLLRYQAAEPGARAYVLVYPRRLALDVTGAPDWRGLDWEDLLDCYTSSSHPWVAQTAAAWCHHLATSLPRVDASTVWGDLDEGQDFVLALRARMAWLYSNYQPPEGIDLDLVGSAAGVSWVLRQIADAPRSGYQMVAEVEENLPVRDYPKYHYASNRHQPLGPSAKVMLMQPEVRTSAGFDWEYLHALWPTMAAARTDWVTHAARPRAAHDREGHQRIVAAGAPRYLGVGFGEAQARQRGGGCLFGARVQYPPDITLQQVIIELRSLGRLVTDLSRVSSPGSDPR